MNNKKDNYLRIVVDVLRDAQKKDYAGYSKFDALNSPFLKLLSFNNEWLRFIWIQLVKQSPVNIRSLLGVKKSRNPKGAALFSRAYLFLYERTQKIEYLDEAIMLLEWLLNNPSPNQTHLCWGYNFIWQDIPPFLQNRNEPNCVVTAFAGEALIHAYRVSGNEDYLKAACSVADFIINDLPILHDSKSERAIAYIQRKLDSVVLNIQVLSGALLVKIWKHTGEKRLLEIAIKQMNYVVKRRTEYCAWFYTSPKEKSPIRHDNYHTGGILDGLLEFYEETQNDMYMDIYWKGLDYYRKHLFEPNGAPRWMNDKKYPHDIHGSAQGIISFSKASRHRKEFSEEAEKTADWTIHNLYRKRKNDFVYRKGRIMKWNYSLMRWCNAWMARALGEMMCL